MEEAVKKGELSIINVEGVRLKMYRQLFYHKKKWVTEEMKTVIRQAHAMNKDSRI